MSDSKQYAVIKTGGKQYRVTPGQRLRVEKLDGLVGDDITIDTVLAIGEPGKEVKIGSPFIDGANVKAKIVSIDKDPKVIAFTKKRRKGFTKTRGHRQEKAELLIEGISA